MSITKDFGNTLWYQEVTGTGSVTIQDGGQSVLISSPSGSSARKRYYTIAMPGERLTFSCLARNIPDGLNGFAGIWIDIPIGTLKNVQQIKSEDLQMYTVEAVVPIHLVGPQKIAFGVGSYSALDGSAEFINPVITRSGTHVVMEGFIQFFATGSFMVRSDYLNYNIGSIGWNPTASTLDITTAELFDFQEGSGLNQFRPIVQVTGAPDGNSTEVLTWTGSCVGFDGKVRIQACNAAGPINLQAVSVDRFVGFRLLMVGDG